MPEAPVDKKQVKELETKLKLAFKDGNFDEVEKLAKELKAVDSENSLAQKIVEKAKKAKSAEMRKKHAVELKNLEHEIKSAFRAGSMEQVDHLADQIRKLEPENKVVKKMAERVMKAKQKIENAAKKEKLSHLQAEMMELFKSQKTDDASKKANEMLAVEWGEKHAMKILQKIAKDKKVEVETLVTVDAPAQPAEKPGFLSRLFGKKDDKKPEPKAAEAKEEKKDAKMQAPAKPMPAKTEEKKEEKRPAKEAKPEEKKHEEAKKPGFLARLFKKKDKKEEPKKVEEKKEAPKPMESKKEEKLPTKEVKKQEGAEKKSFFGSLFGKKEEEPAVKAEAKKPEAPKPAVQPISAAKPALAPMPAAPVAAPKPAESKPVQAAPAPKTPAAPQAIKAVVPPPLKTPAPTAPAPVAAKPAQPKEGLKVQPMGGAPKPATETKKDAKEGEKGNIFTSLFGKKEEAPKEAKKSIIDTIVSKTDEKKKEKEEAKKEDTLGAGLLKFSTYLAQFTAVFVVISAAFFYVQNIDEENRVLSYINIDNYASQLKAVAAENENLDSELSKIDKEIKGYEADVENPNKATIVRIADGRLDWGDLLSKLNEVTESVYEKNALLGYVQYNNYSYNVESGQLSVSGDLSDPKGRNLTKLAELEQAFNYFPSNPDDPDSEVQPYFFGLQEFQSFSKTYDKATDRFKTNFSLSLFTKPPEKK